MIALRSAGRAGFFKSRDFGQVPFLSPLSYANLAAWFRSDLGVKGRTAAQFTAANSETLSKADAAAFSLVKTLTIEGWIYRDTTGNQAIVTKWQHATTTEWALEIDAAHHLHLYVAEIANSSGGVSGTGDTAISTTGAWYHIYVIYDGNGATDADKLKMWVNGTAQAVTVAGTLPTTFQDGAAAFSVGAFTGTLTRYWNGRMGNLGVWNVSTDGHVASYNSGSGRRFSDLASTTGLIGWWELDEESGTRADKGANALTLTDNNTVTSNDGKVLYAVTADASVVARWVEQKSGALLPDQATHTKKPLLKVNIVNGQPVLRFDGTDDFLKVATGALANQPFWGWVVLNDNDAGTRYYFDGGAASKVALYHTLTNLNLNAGSDVGDIDTPSAAELLTFVVNGASSSLKVNGAAFASGDAGAQNQSSGIAIASLNDGTSPLQGDIAEIGFVTGTPSVADLANLKSYINARYNLGVV